MNATPKESNRQLELVNKYKKLAQDALDEAENKKIVADGLSKSYELQNTKYWRPKLYDKFGYEVVAISVLFSEYPHLNGDYTFDPGESLVYENSNFIGWVRASKISLTKQKFRKYEGYTLISPEYMLTEQVKVIAMPEIRIRPSKVTA